MLVVYGDRAKMWGNPESHSSTLTKSSHPQPSPDQTPKHIQLNMPDIQFKLVPAQDIPAAFDIEQLGFPPDEAAELNTLS